MEINMKNCFLILTWIYLVAFKFSHSIMVEFGTSKEPILSKPLAKVASSLQPRTVVPRSPAPVQENHLEDILNPNAYKAPIPHQYRAKIYSLLKTNPNNLLFGTPLDQFYLPSSIQKYNLFKKHQFAKSLGLDYTGPHIFGSQPYELEEIKKTTYLTPSVKYSAKELRHRFKINQNNKLQKVVPEIGVIYSSGIRYYVPQIAYFTMPEDVAPAGVEENSVYDKNDDKFLLLNNNNNRKDQ